MRAFGLGMTILGGSVALSKSVTPYNTENSPNYPEYLTYL